MILSLSGEGLGTLTLGLAKENEDGESLGTGQRASVVNIQQHLDRIVKPYDNMEDSREGDDSVLWNYSSLLE